MSGHPPEIEAALAAERQKLGPNAQGRIAAVQAFIEATAGSAAKSIMAGLVTATQVEGFERVMSTYRAQRSTPAPAALATKPDQQGRISEEQFQKMSARERIDYTRQFDQTQFQQQAGRK